MERCYVCGKYCEEDVLLYEDDNYKAEGLKTCIDCFEEKLELIESSMT